MALAIIAGVGFSIYISRNGDLSPETVYTPVLWALVGGMLGARATHVIDNFDHYSENLGEIFLLWEGGLGWYGGLIGGALAAAICARIKHLPLAKLLDFAAPGVLVGLSVGRIGCLLNGDSHGIATDLPWAITYTNTPFAPNDIAGHPSPVYEIIWNILVVGVLLRLRSIFKQDGELFLYMIALYSFGRFFISWTRDETEVLGALHQAHLISIILFATAVSSAIYIRIKGKSEQEKSISSG